MSDEDVKKKDEDEKEDKPVQQGLFGITEAPKDHPENSDGKLKVIMG